MTRLEALRALYAAVKDGHMPTFPVSFAALGEAAHIADEALERKSVDAALALIAATLPGYVWALGPNNAEVWALYGPIHTARVDGKPATALLLACIAAHIAKEEAPK